MTFFKRIAVPLSAALMLVVGLPSAAQAAECKGMSKSACEKAEQCSYVNSYKTKSGNEVAAYCRNKGKRSSDSKKQKDDKKK
jgi:hypothetical protein